MSDACGNAATAVSRTVTWTSDTQQPVITATGNNNSLGCNPTAAQIEEALGSATATDNCSVGTPTASDGPITGTCTKSQTRTWNVSDACGNAATAVSRTVTWTSDTQKPVITATGDNDELECNPTAAQIEAALGSATATDNCSVGTPTSSDGQITGTCTKSQTRTWNVSDACGNAATAVSRTVTWTSDTQKPVITATGDDDPLGCNPTAAKIEAALGSATATDNCSVGTPTASDGPITGTCTKSQTRTWNVSDACGNAATPVSRTVTWTSDTQKPVIIATGTPANGMLGCNPTAAQISDVLGTATANDNCAVGTPGYTDGAIIINGCSRSQTRTWNVSDACGNAATPVSRTATWIVDITSPVFTTCPQDINVIACTNDFVIYNVVATDNCSSPILSFACSGATSASGSGTGSGSLFMVGVTHVTVTATDACGNIKTCSFNVTVTLNPEINISICTVPTTTIYKGTTSGVGPLGPQSLTLTSTISGGTPGYSYSWSPSTGLNNPNIANPVASPTVTTTYVLTITDSRGCTRSLGITINVRPLSDAVCSGSGNNVKFSVCHIPPGNPSNPQNICISVNALPPHLVSGTNGHNNCYLGPCGQQLCFSTTPVGSAQAPAYSRSMNPVTPITSVADVVVGEEIPADIKDEFSVQVNPNPSTGDFSIQVFSRSNDPILVRIIDNNGVVRNVSSLTSKANSIKVGGNLIGGIYIAEVTQGTNRKTLKLVKLN